MVSPLRASKFAVVVMSEALPMQPKPVGIGVTVVCPEFVHSRIMESERNRPKRYGPRRVLDLGSPPAALAAQVAQRIQSGIDPAQVGRSSTHCDE